MDYATYHLLGEPETTIDMEPSVVKLVEFWSSVLASWPYLSREWGKKFHPQYTN